MRVYPKFFGKRKRRAASDEFYRDKIRASKASVDDVGDGVLDVPNTRTNDANYFDSYNCVKPIEKSQKIMYNKAVIIFLGKTDNGVKAGRLCLSFSR